MGQIIGLTDELKPWTDDEITLRISMIRNMIKRSNFPDNITVIQLIREQETWKELLRRRHDGVRIA